MIVKIEFPDYNCSIGELEVTQLSEHHYRLEQSPLWIETVSIFDVIEAELLDQSTLQFIRVVEKSNSKTYCFSLTKEIAESKELKAALTNADQNGAICEIVSGGLVFNYVALDSNYDPTSDINAMFQ